MSVQIDELQTSVEVRTERAAPSGGFPGSPAPAPGQGAQALKDALRPIVVELLEEELQAYLRGRG